MTDIRSADVLSQIDARSSMLFDTRTSKDYAFYSTVDIPSTLHTAIRIEAVCACFVCCKFRLSSMGSRSTIPITPAKSVCILLHAILEP